MTIAIIVLECVAILANLCLPFSQRMALKMKAADIAREMQLVRGAAESAHAQRAAWPDEQPAGVAPPELAAFLPPGFSFTRAEYQLDWEHWSLGGEGVLNGGDELAGVTVVTHDPRLAGLVASQLREGEVRVTLGNRTTLVVAEPER